MFKLSTHSLNNLKAVHPDLQAIVKTAIREVKYDFTVIEGIRSIDKQIEYVEKEVSKTYNSRHLHGLAVDLLPYNEAGVNCFDPKCHDAEEVFKSVADTMKRLGADVGLEWGGDWKWKDMPHFQLPHTAYPDDEAVIALLKSRGLISK